MILAIESSCDDSSLAIMNLDDYSLIHYEKLSQEIWHEKYGGVVPELACRLHVSAIPAMLERAKPYFKQLKALCATSEPGLSVSLIGGICAVRALSVALNLKAFGVNHLIGHIYSLFLTSQIKLPLGVLLVSGGHTMVLEINQNREISVLCATSDDSFGESFDKVAKMLDLGYPGGARIENLAKNGDDKAFNFTLPLKEQKRLEYSFSGLKNQVRLTIQEQKKSNLLQASICDICASFERVACLHIMDKLERIFALREFRYFGVVGGASANARLRASICELCLKHGTQVLFAPLEFCSDNAAMIARAGVDIFKNNAFSEQITLRARSQIDKSKLF